MKVIIKALMKFNDKQIQKFKNRCDSKHKLEQLQLRHLCLYEKLHQK